MNKIKVTEVVPITGERITFECERNEFIRYGADCWYESYGESVEPCYGREQELEEAYQEYMTHR